MINFFKKEYKDRLNACKEKNKIITLYDENDEPYEEIDLSPIIDEVFKAGWDAYRAAVLEASYLER